MKTIILIAIICFGAVGTATGQQFSDPQMEQQRLRWEMWQQQMEIGRQKFEAEETQIKQQREMERLRKEQLEMQERMTNEYRR